ncbi:ATP-binding protein [Streptomyces sp. NPDC021093]|uniref:ATP-binding protein n=1 Tax=Streptomyces sp. NPDC021093 TaxID=3365112 RepID=UPI00379F7451
MTRLRVGPPQFTARRLTRTSTTLARTRTHVRQTLAAWQLAPVTDDALLVAGELAANALRHALTDHPGQQAWLGLLNRPGQLLITVTDPDPAPPRPGPAHDDADPADPGESGRGLLLVSHLADSWDWTPCPGRGKTVWALLSTWPRRGTA